MAQLACSISLHLDQVFDIIREGNACVCACVCICVCICVLTHLALGPQMNCDCKHEQLDGFEYMISICKGVLSQLQTNIQNKWAWFPGQTNFTPGMWLGLL